MLTDAHCRKAVGKEKPYKLPDSNGLYLFVTPSGFKSWRYKYRFGGKEKLLVIGPYPEISLAQAREARTAARAQLRSGDDPMILRKQQAARQKLEADNTFAAIARQWHETQKAGWSAKHAGQVLTSLENLVFPELGKVPLNSITPPMVLNLVRDIERSSIDIAKRVQRRISAVFVWAIAAGIAENDPAAIIKRALQPLITGQFPAIVDLQDLRKYLRLVEAKDAEPQTRLATRFLALTAARPSMVRGMLWGEVQDLEGPDPLWIIPAARMKLVKLRKKRFEFDFIVPLSRQAVDVLRSARSLFGNSALCFPGIKEPRKALSENTLNKYMRIAAMPHVGHGWRSSFSTLMNERAVVLERPDDRPVIDLMLAHLPGGVEAIYNRYAYLPRRRQLSQEWADMLLNGFAPAASLLTPPPLRGALRSREAEHDGPVIRRDRARRHGEQSLPDVPASQAE